MSTLRICFNLKLDYSRHYKSSIKKVTKIKEKLSADKNLPALIGIMPFQRQKIQEQHVFELIFMTVIQVNSQGKQKGSTRTFLR